MSAQGAVRGHTPRQCDLADVVILSGHGPETTVGIERRTNPFVLADASGELPRLTGL